MEQITISGIVIEVIRKNIKNIHLAVYPPTGRVRIAAPVGVNADAIRLFAISKLGWIKRNQRKFSGQARLAKREYQNRESHYFQGKRYLLNVIEAEAKPKVIIRNKTYIDLYIRPNTPTAKRDEIFNDWYRTEIKKEIAKFVTKWEEILQLKIAEFGVKKMKTKWGTCNIAAKRIWLNLELAKKPVHCLEYVVVHEMLHLLERHHNDRFAELLQQYMSQWKSYKDELNRLPVCHEDWEY